MNCWRPLDPNRPSPSGYAEASRGASRLSRFTCGSAAVARSVAVALIGSTCLLTSSPHLIRAADVSAGLEAEVVVAGVARPIQLALDPEGRLVVLSLGLRGDAAAEVYRFDLRRSLPIDATRVPRVVIPFADALRPAVFGSLAVDGRSGDLFLGEENGNRIYRFGADHRLQPVAVGLNHLLGGSALALDRRGRLVFLDYSSPETNLRSETPLPPSLSWLIDEGYRGPLVFRVDPHEPRPLPRRADLLTPLLPRGGTSPAGQEPLWRLIAVAAAEDDTLILLSSVGEVFRLGSDGELRLVVRLPGGHYHRTNLAVGPDGSVFVCAGFQIRRIYRVSLAGDVSLVASELGDPGGIAFDAAGALYVAETALHRIIRIAPATLR